jgi:hypothetical protein
MADDFSVWNRLLPAERAGNSKESLITKVDRGVPQKKKKGRKRGASRSQGEGHKEDEEENKEESDPHAGKILDIVI